MSDPKKKSLMRNLGEFIGHIVRGVRTDVTAAQKDGRKGERHEVRRTVEEEDRGDVVLRRTTIEEVEIRQNAAASEPEQPAE